MEEITNTLHERIQWALKKPEELKKQNNLNIKELKKIEEEKEKIWGNKMINQNNNCQWTTKLGENLVYDVLKLLGENPRKTIPIDGFKPDWETDSFIYEVKTSSWWVSGTAGEKVLGTWIKYQDIPEKYNKPLKIVCVAYQEYELEYGKIKYFGENISLKTKQVLELAKSWNIEYIRFSDLVKNIGKLL